MTENERREAEMRSIAKISPKTEAEKPAKKTEKKPAKKESK